MEIEQTRKRLSCQGEVSQGSQFNESIKYIIDWKGATGQKRINTKCRINNEDKGASAKSLLCAIPLLLSVINCAVYNIRYIKCNNNALKGRGENRIKFLSLYRNHNVHTKWSVINGIVERSLWRRMKEKFSFSVMWLCDGARRYQNRSSA